MKKCLTRSLIAACVICAAGAIINLVSYFVNGTFLLAQRLNGGEYIGWRGFGLLLSKIIPLEPAQSPDAVTTRITPDLPSLLFTLAAGFVLCFAVCVPVHLAHRRGK